MVPLIRREPAVVAGAVIAVLQALVLFNIVQVDEIQLAAINTALIAVLSLFVRQSSTPTAAPTLKTGTSVAVEGTNDVVIVQPTPPGPIGYEEPYPDDGHELRG